MTEASDDKGPEREKTTRAIKKSLSDLSPEDMAMLDQIGKEFARHDRVDFLRSLDPRPTWQSALQVIVGVALMFLVRPFLSSLDNAVIFHQILSPKGQDIFIIGIQVTAFLSALMAAIKEAKFPGNYGFYTAGLSAIAGGFITAGFLWFQPLILVGFTFAIIGLCSSFVGSMLFSARMRALNRPSQK
jgi:hypothetical protein